MEPSASAATAVNTTSKGIGPAAGWFVNNTVGGISTGAETAQAKLEIMEACGFKVTRNPSEMGKLMKSLL